jgi:hypothetical protein
LKGGQGPTMGCIAIDDDDDDDNNNNNNNNLNFVIILSVEKKICRVFLKHAIHVRV